MEQRHYDIKDREDFRPVALVVLEEEAANWFVNAGKSPFMLFVYDVQPEKADYIPAVRHVDGTARIQTINRRQHPLYYDLLKAFQARTGVPVLVNTSFNTRGEPIVCTPRDAIECFWTSPLDALVIGPFVLEKTSSHGPAAARNMGWRAARSAVIAFTDDDCIPSSGWLKAGMAAMGNDIVGVAGRIIMPVPAIPTDYEYSASGLMECDFVTANCFYRRDALEAIGGFDERFTAAWREDSDLIFTLREHGARVMYTPDAVVIHPVRPAQWGLSIRQQRKSLFNALLYKKHPVLYRRYIQAAPPWHYYGIIGALLVALMGVSRRSGILTLMGLGLWMWLTGRFCMQRLWHTSHDPRHVAEMMVTSAAIPPLAIFWR